MNELGYICTTIHGEVFHIVEIRSTMFAGFSVFSNGADAIAYIATETMEHKSCGVFLKYNPEFKFTTNLIKSYAESVGLFTKPDTRQVYLTGF